MSNQDGNEVNEDRDASNKNKSVDSKATSTDYAEGLNY